jgi:plastocyanin
MRRPAAAALVLVLAGLGPASALAATRSIKVGDNFFVRDAKSTPTVTVRKGTRVRFKWTGTAPHNVQTTSAPARFASKVKSSGTYSRRLTRRGTYRLVCIVHADEMKLTLKVR